MELPASYTEQMQELLGDEFSTYLSSFNQRSYAGLRVNTLKISVQEFLNICPFPLQPIPWIDNGFYYDAAKVKPAKHPYYYAGLYYLQEPSAMTPANRFPISPGDKVLDLCAAPGGKATELGAKLQGSGLLVANDISHSRAKGLLKNIELFGLENTLVTSETPEKLASYFPEYFDKILIDAPCSGEGMFRRDHKMIKAWQEHGPDYFEKIQAHILEQASCMLKDGGLLLYATCTFNLRENEGVLDCFLKNHPEFSVAQIAPYDGFSAGMPELIDADPSLKNAVRIFPHKMKGEGHFLALLQKKGQDGPAGSAQAPKKSVQKLPEEIQLFCKDYHRNLDKSRMKIQGSYVYYLPEDMPNFDNLRCLRTGLLLGVLKAKRFEPSQALAMSMRKEDYEHVLDLPLNDERVLRYLKGETLSMADLTDSRDKGWYLLCVDGYPLGFGKVQNGLLKNKYLPGWRMAS